MVYIKTYIFNHFYQQYLVLLTIVPRNTGWLPRQEAGREQLDLPAGGHLRRHDVSRNPVSGANLLFKSCGQGIR